MALTPAELAHFRRLAERADPWERRWANTEGRRRRGMFIAIDREHRKEVLDALMAMELAGERGGPAIRRLLALIETALPKDSQRLPATQAALAQQAKLTSTQASHAFKWLAARRVLCCREKTKGPRNSPVWEVYAGYASCLPEAKVLAEMDRQNAQDFAPGSTLSKELDEAFALLSTRAEADPDTFSYQNHPRQRNFDA
jgi:hypothetical protein